MFKNHFVCIIILLVSCLVSSQDFSDSWEGYFSYLEIRSISQSDSKIYAASENAVFTYDVNTFELDEITTVNGLSGEIISTIYYSQESEILVIGYETGLMELYFESDESVLTITDIIDKPTIPPNQKIINHFNEFEGLVYIATGYGISVYDLQRLEFGDTYFIGSNGSQIDVYQTTIIDNFIYAACNDTVGIRKANLDSDDLINYQVWEAISNNPFIAIQNVDGILYAIDSNRRIYRIINDNLTTLTQYASLPVDVKAIGDRLIVVIENRVYVYNQSFVVLNTIELHPDFITKYSAASVLNDTVYVGTTNNIPLGKPGFGVLQVDLLNPVDYTEIHPSGPLLNRIFEVDGFNGELWTVFGGYSLSYNFNGGLGRSGVSHYENEEWVNIPYDSLVPIDPSPRFLSHIAINPFNPDQVYISSYYSGLIEINNNQPVQIFNEENSSIEAFANAFNLVLPTMYDREGVLWVTNGRVNSPLNKLENGQWTAFDFGSVINPPTSNLGFGKMAKNENTGTIFLSAHSYGIIGFNENNGSPLIKSISEEANLPSPYVKAVAFDNNSLWIGTSKGLRVLFNTTNFFEDETIETQPIIFLEDGIPKELLEQQFITDIIVDGSNNKWISTIGSGLFYFSSDGQETIFHFTKDNSALPTNNVNDLYLDNDNGRIYAATDRGLVSFRSGSSKPKDGLSGAYVYPNPARPGFNIVEEKIKIKDISDNVNIKITDIEGNLVAEAQSNTNLRYQGYNLEIDGGTAYWNGKNLANNVVASGVYLVMLSDLDSFETKVLKLMVVR